MIKRLAHICFVVRDLDVSQEFYRDKLGFEDAFEFRDEQGNLYGRYFHIGEGTFLELFVGDHDEPSETAGYKHFCLQVDDIEAESERLRSLGVDVTPVKSGTDNSLQAWLADPDGNRIELHEYTAGSKQRPFLQ